MLLLVTPSQRSDRRFESSPVACEKYLIMFDLRASSVTRVSTRVEVSKTRARAFSVIFICGWFVGSNVFPCVYCLLSIVFPRAISLCRRKKVGERAIGEARGRLARPSHERGTNDSFVFSRAKFISLLLH